VIFGIGTDIVRVARMEKNLERYGERFAHRILSDDEMREFAEVSQRGRFLAKRFAAKEAASKALGSGFRDGLSLKHIAVAHDAKGKPLLSWNGKGLELLAQLGIGDGFISIADEDEYAVAHVILMKRS
jgi:holo-[acyl-carrier protein] synthase